LHFCKVILFNIVDICTARWCYNFCWNRKNNFYKFSKPDGKVCAHDSTI